MATHHRFFRQIRLRLAGRRKHRARRASVGVGTEVQRQSARVRLPRLGGSRPAAQAGFAGAFGATAGERGMIDAVLSTTGVAATRNFVDSFLRVSRRYFCL